MSERAGARATSRTFLLPDLGEGLTEAEIVRWSVAEGDEVEVDQTIVEVETAKAVVEVPSPYAGTVLERHAAEGETLAVGSPLVTVGAGGAGGAGGGGGGGGSGNVLIGYGTSGHAGVGRRRRPRTRAVAPSSTPETGGPVRVISPLVRKLAHEHGIDLHSLEPTGFGGIVTKADVERACTVEAPTAAESTQSPMPGTREGERRIPLNGFRKAVSEALSRSRREIPEATVWVDVDATRLWELRESARTATDPGPGLIAYLARFVVAGLKAYPVLNARLDTERDEIVEFDRIHLGIAVQGERGLVVPAVMDAGLMTAYELDERIRDLTARARSGKVSAEELSAATFTLNNYGSFGVDGSAAIINHPQVGILGFGRIIDKPWVVDGELAIRKMTTMSFVFDHRVCDGGTAAGFMRLVADAIENPAAAVARL